MCVVKNQKPMQKRSNYDKIDYKNNTIYTNYIFIRKKTQWLLFNGWSRRFKIIKHCEVE